MFEFQRTAADFLALVDEVRRRVKVETAAMAPPASGSGLGSGAVVGSQLASGGDRAAAQRVAFWLNAERAQGGR